MPPPVPEQAIRACIAPFAALVNVVPPERFLGVFVSRIGTNKMSIFLLPADAGHQSPPDEHGSTYEIREQNALCTASWQLRNFADGSIAANVYMFLVSKGIVCRLARIWLDRDGIISLIPENPELEGLLHEHELDIIPSVDISRPVSRPSSHPHVVFDHTQLQAMRAEPETEYGRLEDEWNADLRPTARLLEIYEADMRPELPPDADMLASADPEACTTIAPGAIAAAEASIREEAAERVAVRQQAEDEANTPTDQRPRDPRVITEERLLEEIGRMNSEVGHMTSERLARYRHSDNTVSFEANFHVESQIQVGAPVYIDRNGRLLVRQAAAGAQLGVVIACVTRYGHRGDQVNEVTVRWPVHGGGGGGIGGAIVSAEPSELEQAQMRIADLERMCVHRGEALAHLEQRVRRAEYQRDESISTTQRLATQVAEANRRIEQLERRDLGSF